MLGCAVMRRPIDLTAIESIYQRRLRTVQVRLTRSYAASQSAALLTVSGPADTIAVLGSLFAGLDDDQEHLLLLVLNQAQDVVGFKLLATGGQDRVEVDPKIVFRNALLLGARSIILAHNHPSGDAEPSAADVVVTQRVIAAGQVLDIPLLDHVVYTPSASTSLRQRLPEIFIGNSAG